MSAQALPYQPGAILHDAVVGNPPRFNGVQK